MNSPETRADAPDPGPSSPSLQPEVAPGSPAEPVPPAVGALARGLAKAGVAGARHHLFFCVGPDCCTPAAGEALWECAKRRVRELGLPVMRTKAACFRVCAGGPILAVYPAGVWYAGVTAERLERILCEHIRDGAPVREWIVAQNDDAPAPGSHPA